MPNAMRAGAASLGIQNDSHDNATISKVGAYTCNKEYCIRRLNTNVHVR